MTLFLNSIYYRLLHDMRVKQAIFFSSVFPLLLFVMFTSIWGGSHDQEYNFFLLTGIMCATLASEGLYAIGAVVKNYYETKLIRFFRVTPINVLIHFLSIVLSRLIFVTITLVALLILAYFMYGLIISAGQFLQIYVGLVVGLIMFSSLGLMISFSSLKEQSSSGVVNFIFFVIVFLSNAYYPLELINPSLNSFADALPLNHLVNIARGEDLLISGAYCLIATVIFVFGFRFLFNRYQLTR